MKPSTRSELGLEINWIEQDLDQSYTFDNVCNLIVVLWYVDLDLIARLTGHLVCEEHQPMPRSRTGQSQFPRTPLERCAKRWMGLEICSTRKRYR